jgi:hypothetical protein
MSRRFPLLAAGALVVVVALGVGAGLFVLARSLPAAASARSTGESDPTAPAEPATGESDPTAPATGESDPTALAEPAATEESTEDNDGADDVAALDARTVLPGRQATLTAALAAYAATDQAEFALAVVDHRTGLSYTFNGDEAFATASVVKVDILAALLLRAQDAGRGLTATEQDLADIMIRYSDNDAASTLWWMIGGADGLAAADERLGLTGTVPGPDGWWGMSTTTVSDRVRLLDVIADPDGPLASFRDYVLDLMSRVAADQAWGASAGADPEETVALKNGWVDDATGTWIINTTGRITGPDTDLTIVVLSDRQPGYAAGVAAVERIVALVRSALA